jgi:hypothetical protein
MTHHANGATTGLDSLLESGNGLACAHKGDSLAVGKVPWALVR